MSGRIPRLLSIKAAAEATTLPASSLYDLVARGKIRAVRNGRAIRIREDDLIQWIDSRTERAT